MLDRDYAKLRDKGPTSQDDTSELYVGKNIQNFVKNLDKNFVEKIE